ncbi:MAG TPA: DHH family phosphoesterase [Candidatus Saccharimonadales bacterium]
MYEKIQQALESAQTIVIVQAENPDGDSLGSAIALEAILEDIGKAVSMHCSVEMPKYLRYIDGWDRVSIDFNTKADMAIIVDTVSDVLLSKTLAVPEIKHFFETHPVFALDHHGSVTSSLPFEHELVIAPEAVATGELIIDIATKLGWHISKDAAEALYASIMADSLGLTTANTTASSFRAVATLVEQGAVPAEIEAKRREFMKKSAEILAYKGRLLERIEYYLDGALALVHIPWEEIAEYSDQYNPSVLVLDEMRLVYDVKLAVAIKTYPDGKLTGKLRANPEAKIADVVAAYFGGGGHGYSAGFRVYESYEHIKKELVEATDKALGEINR